MKIIPGAALAVSLIAAAAPAFAQYGAPSGDPRDWPDHARRGDWRGDRGERGGWDLDRRIDWMQGRINHGRADGSLDFREADRAQDELRRIRDHERRERDEHGGRLDGRARDELSARLDRLNEQIRWLRHNDDRRPW